jgi:hypothetical protein
MKKNTILTLVILLFIEAVNAQTQKGDQAVGVSLNFYTYSGNFNFLNGNVYSTGTTSASYFTATPTYSYFLANNLDLGAGVGFGTGKNNSIDQFDNTATKSFDRNYIASIYLRKYFLFNNKIGLRTGPFVSFQYFESKVNYSPNTNQENYGSSAKSLQTGINVDFVCYPAKKIGLAVNVGALSYYHQQSGSQQQYSGTNGFNLQFLSNNLMLSAFYVIGH